MSGSSSPMPDAVETTPVVGIDIGMESCTMSCLTMDKRQVIKSTPFANSVQGFEWLFERLAGLGVAPKQILVGLEATSRSGEKLLQALRQQWLPGLPVTSGPDACLRATTGVASENGSARCGHDCASTAEPEKRASATCRVSRWPPTAS
jgi:hypothetical protein